MRPRAVRGSIFLRWQYRVQTREKCPAAYPDVSRSGEHAFEKMRTIDARQQ
jgi:hypothetical protein